MPPPLKPLVQLGFRGGLFLKCTLLAVKGTLLAVKGTLLAVEMYAFGGDIHRKE